MEKRKNRQKRYGWLIIFTLITWLLVGLMVMTVDPKTVKDVLFENSYLPMMTLLGVGFFWLFSIILLSAKKALMWSLGIISFLYLKIWGMGSLINAILIFGLLISIEIYDWSGKKHREIEA